MEISGFSERTTAAALRAKFEEYGEVQDFVSGTHPLIYLFRCMLIRWCSEQNFYDPRYAESALGFGEVEFVREKDAEAALQDMNNKEFVDNDMSWLNLRLTKGFPYSIHVSGLTGRLSKFSKVMLQLSQLPDILVHMARGHCEGL